MSTWFEVGLLASVLVLGFTVANGAETAPAPQLPYDLSQVQHIEAFVGSARAKALLSRQGFVVTDQQFRQIFQPYLAAPRARIPTFITVDSVWHTYHVLLEEGVQRIEQGQARLLQRFSERLHQLAAARKDSAHQDLAAFAAVGWAIQDSGCLQSLPADERAVVARTLKAMETGGLALFFGLPLEPDNFRPAGFYTQTPELARYFVARRWYATSAFRLESEAETLRALHLALLVDSDRELKRLHRELTSPAEAMVGPTDDPGVDQYIRLASKVAKGALTEEKIRQILSDFRREAGKLPGPRVNDQFLNPEEFDARERLTKGMRLFGGRQMPSAVLMQQTVEPAIPGRIVPSGIDVFAAGPLACEAGRHALKAMEPDKTRYDAICRASCGPLPDSLHGRAMQLLHLIHEPLPETAPAALRTRAWQGKQLWTALGAWAEERHTWVLHAKPLGGFGMSLEAAPGYVSPYPKFYRQLGQLARRTARVMPQVAAEPDFSAAGREWLKARQRRVPEESGADDEKRADVFQEMAESIDTEERMPQAMAEYFREIGKNIEMASTHERWQAWQALDAAAKRCSEGKGVTAADRRFMRGFLRSPQGNAAQLLPEFAALCDQLATIAEKELAGQPLDAKEVELIKDYGAKLARFHFYGDGGWMSRDDFPCITPVFRGPLRGISLYVGVARPEAIYVVLLNGKRLVLHRGAVLSYREFTLPLTEGLDDDKWRAEASAGRAPAPPGWTISFRSGLSQQERAEILQETADRLRLGELDPEDCPVAGHEVSAALIDRLLETEQARKTRGRAAKKETEPSDEEQIVAEKVMETRSKLFRAVLQRAMDADVPDLLDKVLPAVREEDRDIRDLFSRLQRLHWKPHRGKLIALMHGSSSVVADWAACVLGSDPEGIDVAGLAKAYDQQQPEVRKRYCYLIGRSRQPGIEGKHVLADALRDQAWQVRCQAAAAVAAGRVVSAEILAGIRAGIEDERPRVAAEMVRAAVALGLNDTAPQMLARLRTEAQTSRVADREERSGGWNPLDHETGCPDLTEELIAGLGELKYLPAKDTLRSFVFPSPPSLLMRPPLPKAKGRPTEARRAAADSNQSPFAPQDSVRDAFGGAAFKALLKIEPQNKLPLLSEVFRDRRCSNDVLAIAIAAVTEEDDAKYVKAMLPLFEDVGRDSDPGSESDAVSVIQRITNVLEHADARDPEQCALFGKIRDSLLKQTHGPNGFRAIEALKHLDPATAAREVVSVALDKKMDGTARTSAIARIEDTPKPWPIRELMTLLDVGDHLSRAAGAQIGCTIGSR